jgi:hypothetical protein
VHSDYAVELAAKSTKQLIKQPLLYKCIDKGISRKNFKKISEKVKSKCNYSVFTMKPERIVDEIQEIVKMYNKCDSFQEKATYLENKLTEKSIVNEILPSNKSKEVLIRLVQVEGGRKPSNC